MLTYDRSSLGRGCERILRRAISMTPAGLVMPLVLASAWYLLWSASRVSSATGPASCLRVVVAQRDGRVAWVVDPTIGIVNHGAVLARLDGQEGDGVLPSPVTGVVHAVLRKAGDDVASGDPVVIVAPSLGATCR